MDISDLLTAAARVPQWSREKAQTLADLISPRVMIGGVPMDEGEILDRFSGVVGPAAAAVSAARRMGTISPREARAMLSPKTSNMTDEMWSDWQKRMFQRYLERENPAAYVRQDPSRLMP